MKDMNLNPDNIPNFNLPPKLIDQLYEFSGNAEGSRGFLLLHINQDGAPMVFFRADNQIIELGLRKALEQFILDFEEADKPIGLEGEGSDQDE
jgi:hypothetical protein|tara:strand:- start:4526 stop:4804 length:279 start_codon:yes stop_codon:yes gene_type:complete